MVASKLEKYLHVKDKNEVVVSSWAVGYKPGIAKCSHCKCEVSYKAGKSALTHHSESSKHTNNAPKPDDVAHQLTISESLSNSQKEKEDKLMDKVKEFEITLTRSLSNHNISMDFLDCIQEQLQKYCGDAEGREKLCSDMELLKLTKMKQFSCYVIAMGSQSGLMSPR